jgi:hypothetical protein
MNPADVICADKQSDHKFFVAPQARHFYLLDPLGDVRSTDPTHNPRPHRQQR